MNSKFRNIFLVFGVVAVVIMLFTFDVSYDDLLNNLRRAGFYLPLVLLLWLFIYLINTLRGISFSGVEEKPLRWVLCSCISLRFRDLPSIMSLRWD